MIPALESERLTATEAAEILYHALVEERKSFWYEIAPLYKDRTINRLTMKLLIARGLKEAEGNYVKLTRLFGMPQTDYVRLMNFLKTHDLKVPNMPFRKSSRRNRQVREVYPLPSLALNPS